MEDSLAVVQDCLQRTLEIRQLQQLSHQPFAGMLLVVIVCFLLVHNIFNERGDNNSPASLLGDIPHALVPSSPGIVGGVGDGGVVGAVTHGWLTQ